MKKFFIISFILISIFLNYGCKEQKSTLTINNIPHENSGKVAIFIYDYSDDTDKIPVINFDEIKELRKEASNEELLEYFTNAIMKLDKDNLNKK